MRTIVRRQLGQLLIWAMAAASGCGDPPTRPDTSDLSGTWTGTSTYPNAPFELRLTHTGTTLRGEYRDRLDRSTGVTGTFTSPTFAIVVDFGDAKLNINGVVQTARQAEGTMFTSALGNTMFPYTMTR